VISFVEYLKIPGTIALGIIVVFFVIQVIGEILEFKGKVVPEIMKIRKYFARKKQEREMLAKIPEMLANTQKILDEFNAHYSADNITKRDNWMRWVDHQAEVYDDSIAEIKRKLDENNEITLGLLIDSKRNTIIDFAAKVVDDNYPATHEQFRRVFKLYDEYENIIAENHMKNGEADVAHRIIQESYKDRVRNRTFVEDVRGY
jgi:hypothetical protein